MSSSWGNSIRIQIFGESHGGGIGVVMDGMPSGEPIDLDELQVFMARRAPGQGAYSTARKEADAPEFLSGLLDGHTTGAPLAALIRNGDTRSKDYSAMRWLPRPGHADYTAEIRYNSAQDTRGGGHFSGRLTLPLVAAGVIAKKQCGFSFKADLIEIGGERDKSKWASLLDATKAEGDSIGGIVECRVDGVPAGLGEPFFDSVESLISHAVFSIPGVRGIEFGDGFAASRMKGSEHNDSLSLSDTPLNGVADACSGGSTASLRAAPSRQALATARPVPAKNGAG